MNPVSLRLGLALSAATLLAATQAQAAGTLAGADVSNTATVDYEVGGVAQPQESSNTTTFKVDRRINLTVAEVGGAATVVVPGATARALTFTVTNNANSPLDFRLDAVPQSGGAAPFGGTDNFDATGLQFYVEEGTTPGFQAGEDTLVTFLDEVAPDATVTVYVVGDIPGTQVNGDVAAVTLVAIAAQSVAVDGSYVATPAVLAADATQATQGQADDPDFIDTVFGDAAGAAPDTAGNGQHAARDQFNVVTATLAVSKSSTVVTDPFNCSIAGDASSCANPPKAIPGAVIEYCLDVNNSGAASAGSIVLTDAIPANTSFVSGSIRSAATATGLTPASGCDVGSGVTEDNDNGGGDETDPDGGDHNLSTAGAVTVRTPSINSGSRFKASFRVTVD